ncbi:MAG: hypothetical protein B7Y36_18565 [Novosphingobium sp. 28-62-57]|uniref:DUF190 domain-containing protein n=1 Tax=Novosphingobium sp. 28-62-57 TaxID=1970409 RepID=UPI000BDB7F69|nr:DUF190 domain-containing protein [Novosphingobium sp. 28-62-57]OYZ07924.1 MAG: hypothetical protein B7Y36_18565 [Novosphingobium sp. 28-62-57]
MQDKAYSLLRIFTDELALSGDRPVFEVVLEKAKVHQLLGVTVLRGRVGFGHSNLIHASRFLDHNYPLVVEIVDEEGRLRSFVTEISAMRGIGMITIAPVEALLGARKDLA